MSNEETEEHRAYSFGEYTLDLDREALYRGERELHLRPQAFRALRILLQNSGRLISKKELHDALWKQCVVTDDSLAHCIADIRRALGDSGFEMIRTVPKRGYVFDHPVSREDAGPATPPAPRRHRAAYQAGAVVAGLAAAGFLLFGAGHGGETPAAAAGLGDGEDVLPVAIEVAPSQDGIDVRNELEKGQFFFKRRGEGDIERAETCFKAALELDPEFAPAWIGLAGVYSVRLGNGVLSREEGIPLFGDATRHAIRLAPDSAEAHARRSRYYQVAGEPALAQQHIEKALALDPNDVLVLGIAAGELAQHNRFDEAIDLQRRALQGDPTSVLLHHNLVWMLLAAGRHAEAAVTAAHYRGLYPPGVGDAGDLFADVEILQGNYEQALIQVRSMPKGPARDRDLAIIHHALGQDAEAGAALQRLLDANDEQARIHAAEVFAQRGENDAAMRWLFNVIDSPDHADRPRERLWQDTLWLLSPYLVGLRTDQRWQELYAQVLDARGYSKFLARAVGGRAPLRE